MEADTNSWFRPGFAPPSAAYTSATQQARHLTEGWMAGHGFCPALARPQALPPAASASLGGKTMSRAWLTVETKVSNMPRTRPCVMPAR